jgi:hypothetical protein
MGNRMKKTTGVVLAVILLVMMVGLAVVPAIAFTQATPIVIETPTDILQGIGATTNLNTFCANGRQWILYTNEASDVVYRSATEENPDDWTAETLIVADTFGYGPELSIWFDDFSNTIHYARHDFSNMKTMYRMGTPGTDGTITWADVEQTVHDTPSNLVTFRISMCTDIDGNPWVAWVDDDGIATTTGILYIESSSTDNGTWTEWAYENITVAGQHVWFAQIIPISEAPYSRVEVEWTTENTSHVTKLMSSSEVDNFTAVHTIAASTSHLRPDAFSANNMGASSVTCVYTDNTGHIMSRGHTTITTWSTADAAVEIVDSIGSTGPWRPSLTNDGGPYDDLYCIFSDNSGIYQLVRPFGEDWDTIPTSVYYNDEGVINRHTASYEAGVSTGTPLGLAYQYTDGGDDTIYYWWLTDDEWGYYEGTETESTTFDLASILPYAFMGIALIAIIGVGMSGALSVASIIILAIAAVVTVVGVSVILSALNAW